jgi:hypothetical protein
LRSLAAPGVPCLCLSSVVTPWSQTRRNTRVQRMASRTGTIAFALLRAPVGHRGAPVVTANSRGCKHRRFGTL